MHEPELAVLLSVVLEEAAGTKGQGELAEPAGYAVGLGCIDAAPEGVRLLHGS